MLIDPTVLTVGNVRVTYDDKKIKFTQHARKKSPDLTLKFKDRAQGRKDGFMYGFNIELYTSDIIKGQDGAFYNRADDNARVVIINRLNTEYKGPGDDELKDEVGDPAKDSTGEKIMEWGAYEFLSTDDGLDMNSNLFQADNTYEEFIQAIQSPISNTPPQFILLKLYRYKKLISI